MIPPKDSPSEKPLLIRRGRVESVDLFEVKESELDILEKGSPAEIQFNFAIFLLSIAFSSIASLVTTATFKYRLAETVFLIFAIFGIIIGAYLLILWQVTRKSISGTVKAIRDRIIDDGRGPGPAAAPAPEVPKPPSAG